MEQDASGLSTDRRIGWKQPARLSASQYYKLLRSCAVSLSSFRLLRFRSGAYPQGLQDRSYAYAAQNSLHHGNAIHLLHVLWKSFQELAKTPADSVTQNLVLQKSELLLSRAQTLYNDLKEYQANIDMQIQEDVARVNEIGEKEGETINGDATWYKVVSDINLDANFNELPEGSNYNWNAYAYIPASYVKKINTAKDGYKSPNDVFEYPDKDYEYHIYVNIEHEELSHLFDGLFQTFQQKERNDPVPENMELFVKAQIAKGNEATFTAKNCLINQDILNKLI